MIGGDKPDLGCNDRAAYKKAGCALFNCLLTVNKKNVQLILILLQILGESDEGTEPVQSHTVTLLRTNYITVG